MKTAPAFRYGFALLALVGLSVAGVTARADCSAAGEPSAHAGSAYAASAAAPAEQACGGLGSGEERGIECCSATASAAATVAPPAVFPVAAPPLSVRATVDARPAASAGFVPRLAAPPLRTPPTGTIVLLI